MSKCKRALPTCCWNHTVALILKHDMGQELQCIRHGKESDHRSQKCFRNTSSGESVPSVLRRQEWNLLWFWNAFVLTTDGHSDAQTKIFLSAKSSLLILLSSLPLFRSLNKQINMVLPSQSRHSQRNLHGTVKTAEIRRFPHSDVWCDVWLTDALDL